MATSKKLKKVCPVCSVEYYTFPCYDAVYCGKKCYLEARHRDPSLWGMWNGGRSRNKRVIADRTAARRQKSLAAGICTMCQKNPIEKREFCLSCYPKSLASKRKDWAKHSRTYKFKKYGLTKKQYEEMVREREGLCEICHRPNQRNFHLAVDHDHETNLVRGLTCNKCNTVLGMADDDPEILRKAAAYLEKYKEAHALEQMIGGTI